MRKMMGHNERSTIQRGNEFCRVVCDILRAAGFDDIITETRDNFKKTDISATYCSLEGHLRYRIEAKDHCKTITKDECIKFIVEYGTLIESRQIDRAWFISRGQISADGRALIDAKFTSGLKCFTFIELQRSLLNIDRYLRDIINIRSSRGLDNFYIKPRSRTGLDLEEFVRSWIDKKLSEPLAIIGSYGQGKSTFALYLAARLAEEALNDPVQRVPILVPLGDIVDEQSLDGLIGKTLASSHRASNYHFDLFRALNDAGRFVIIFDGLDEMKHGMTPGVFEINIRRLLEVDSPQSKILLLGRDTAFHDDVEFKSIISGKKSTSSGREIASITRREIKHIEVGGFNISEARVFVRDYMNYRYNSNDVAAFSVNNEGDLSSRIDNILSGELDNLIIRPVHAQMICEVSLRTNKSINNMSLFDLYDQFIHYLIERETAKPGRFPGFRLEIRRQFNAAFAWWLWEQGKSSTTTLADTPIDLYTLATAGIEHNFDDDGLKRELIAGCLIEKGIGTVYFGHRSIQEFLVAEHLVTTNVIGKSGVIDIGRIWQHLSPVITDFIIDFIMANTNPEKIIARWMNALDNWRAENLSVEGILLFFRLYELSQNDINSKMTSSWGIILPYIVINRVNKFTPTTKKALSYLASMTSNAKKDIAIVGWLIKMHSLAERSLIGDVDIQNNEATGEIVEFIVQCFSPEWVNDTLSRINITYETLIIPENQPLLWALFYAAQGLIDRSTKDHFELHYNNIIIAIARLVGFSFHIPCHSDIIISVPIERVSEAINRREYSQQGRDNIIRLLTDDRLLKKIVLADPEGYRKKHPREYRIGGLIAREGDLNRL